MLGLGGCSGSSSSSNSGNEPMARIEKDDAGCVKPICPPPDDCKMPDLLTQAPACLAATGLPGKNLLCVDFNNTTIGALTGWLFSACTNASPANTNWHILGGKLQIDAPDFTVFKGDCKFTLPALSSADFAAYTSFALSVVHTVDLNDGIAATTAPQVAQVSLNSSVIMSSTSKQLSGQAIQIQQKGGTTAYQPMFRLFAVGTSGANFSGWKIDSIAINGIK